MPGGIAQPSGGDGGGSAGASGAGLDSGSDSSLFRVSKSCLSWPNERRGTLPVSASLVRGAGGGAGFTGLGGTTGIGGRGSPRPGGPPRFGPPNPPGRGPPRFCPAAGRKLLSRPPGLGGSGRLGGGPPSPCGCEAGGVPTGGEVRFDGETGSLRGPRPGPPGPWRRSPRPSPPSICGRRPPPARSPLGRSVPGLTIVRETRLRSPSTPMTQTETTSPTLTTSCGLLI